MKIIDVINSRCNCEISKVTASFRGETRIVYSKIIPGDSVFTLNSEISGVKVQLTYIAKQEAPPEGIEFMEELIGCILENQEPWALHDALSKVAESSAELQELDTLLYQALDTLIQSHLFDKAAILLFNEKRMELRGVNIVGITPYPAETVKQFKSIRVPAQKEWLLSFGKQNDTPQIVDDKIFEQLDKIRLLNKPILSPLVASQKVYGVLVTYNDKPYNDKHFHASKSTARFMTAMLSAVIVYKKYRLTLASEKQMALELESNASLIALGKYAAAMAHEVKNPLISIGGFAKRLMKAISDPSLQRMAMIISTESERLERLTEDILSFSKKSEPQKSPLNLFEESLAIRMLFEARSKETDIELDFDVPEEAEIMVDRNQFRQVVVNLIANAMTAIGNGGSVNVTFSEDSRYSKLTIADTGAGIPNEYLPRLFKPFFTTSSNGTGLGLAISKKIMINHGGDITVRNSGKGAEFTLLIPKS